MSINIAIKKELLKGISQEDFINQQSDNGWEDPSVFDLNTMFSDDHLYKRSIEIAMAGIINDDVKLPPYDAYCLIKIADKLEISPLEWEIEFYNDIDNMELLDVIATIIERASAMQSFAKECFQVAQDAIISKAIDCNLDSDMHELDFKELFNYGSVLDKTFISDSGDVTVEYNQSLAQWESAEGFTFAIDEEGLPFNKTPEESFELDNGEIVFIKSFTEKSS